MKEFNADEHFPFNEKATPCCKNLRCKSMYYRPDERPGLLHDEEAMGYWCTHTNDPLGPDDGLASHKRCQEGRSCFEAAIKPMIHKA